MTSLLPSFRNYLKIRRYQPTTIKNYLADIRKYLKFLSSASPQPENIFSSANLSAYIKHLQGKNNAQRYLASLNKFCQFAADQKLIKSKKLLKKIIKQVQKPTPPSPAANLNQLLAQFEQYLISQHRSPATIKNYLADLRQYLNYYQQNHGN